MRTISKPQNRRIVKPIPVPAITTQERDWQREVYEADPTGGAASSY